jgi:hypothetical protein
MAVPPCAGRFFLVLGVPAQAGALLPKGFRPVLMKLGLGLASVGAWPCAPAPSPFRSLEVDRPWRGRPRSSQINPIPTRSKPLLDHSSARAMS